jgi:hypothetical protein
MKAGGFSSTELASGSPLHLQSLKSVWWIIILAGFFSFASATHSQSTTNSSEKIISFFKQAMSSPFDVEEFIGTERILHEVSLPGNSKPFQPPVITYRGSRSGSNFFLVSFSGTNQLRQSVAGRRDAETYTVNKNTLNRSIGPGTPQSPNQIPVMGNVIYMYVCQFLNMGMSDLVPETVAWHENEFEATTAFGNRVYGMLEFSNGLPSRLTVSSGKGAPAERIRSYVYPNPPTSLGGFPSQIIFWRRERANWTPGSELTLMSVKMPSNALGADYFASAQFVNTNIKYLHIESNGLMYNVKTGRLVQLASPKGGVKPSTFSGKLDPSVRKTVVIIWLVVGITIPVSIFAVMKFKKNKNK